MEGGLGSRALRLYSNGKLYSDTDRDMEQAALVSSAFLQRCKFQDAYVYLDTFATTRSN